MQINSESVLATLRRAKGPLGIPEIARQINPQYAKAQGYNAETYTRTALLSLLAAGTVRNLLGQWSLAPSGEPEQAPTNGEAAQAERKGRTRHRNNGRGEQADNGPTEQPEVSVTHSQEDNPMAKATPKKKTKSTAVLDVPVAFGNVSIGDGTARLGIVIDREQLTVENADLMLCGRRLTGAVVVQPNGDSTDQTYLVDGIKHELRAVFDVKRIGVSPKEISTGLTFALKGLELAELGFFAKRSGRLVVDAVTELESEAEEPEETEE